MRTIAGRLIGGALGAAVIVGGIVTLALGFSNRDWLRLLQGVAVVGLGVCIIGGTIVLVLVRLGGWRYPQSEDDFEMVVRRAERMAGGYDDELDGYDVPDFYDYAEDDALDDEDDEEEVVDDEAFRMLVRRAVEDLPMEFHRVLEHVAIVISDGGDAVRTGRGRRGAYGLYQGDTVTQDYFHDRIVIFRDTLVRDFGHDPGLLRRQVARTVRHELAHHLGWDEKGVRRLGL